VPTIITLIVEAVEHTGRFRARLDTGVVVCAASDQPLLDSARKLISWGCDPNSILEMKRPGSDDCALKGRLGSLAGLIVDETHGCVFAKWRPLTSEASTRIKQFRARASRIPRTENNAIDERSNNRRAK
jgi:hypothetical protein